MRRWMIAVSGIAALALVLNAAPANAQITNSDNIVASATVLAPLQVQGLRDLDFGNVFPGVSYTINPTDATAGAWDIGGVATAEVSLVFTLPANLVSGGGDNLPIDWTGNTAGWNSTDAPAGATAFDPSAPPLLNMSGAGALFVYIGATISPVSTQPNGVYTADVTLTVDYTGS